MIIYLDANVVLYCARYQGFIFGETAAPAVNEPLRVELVALRRIVHLEQLGEGWHAAAPRHLMDELLQKPNPDEEEVFTVLLQAWQEAAEQEAGQVSEEAITRTESSLRPLALKDRDRRHLAEAIALGAVWFLTNDRRLINRTRPTEYKKAVCRIQGVWVARPSECISEISRGVLLRGGEPY